MMTYTTFEDRLIATGGRPAGFDYLRIGLATAVIFFHSFDLTAGHNVAFEAMHGIFRPLDALVLPMFFSLSGFLVAGSFERSRTLISFLGLRAIRLVPALLIETVLSAIVIGLLFTDISYKQYFSSPTFFSYFLNIIGDIHYHLPGVFTENRFPSLVNGQLWTIPWELKCYASISFISIIGLARRKTLFLVLLILLNLALFVHHGFLGTRHTHHEIGANAFDGILLVLSFLYGISFYFFRLSMVWSKWVFIAAMPLVLLFTSLPIAFFGDWLTPILIAYITVYLGLLEPRRSKLISSGDYSYGVYLYGFPVQQALVATRGAAGIHWYINFPLALTLAVLLAMASWHVVEKHAARLRPLLFKVEQMMMEHYATLKANIIPETSAGPGIGDTVPAGEPADG